MAQPYSTFADNCYAGRSVFITGAASGMGLETARAFASKGAEVVMADRDAAGLDRYGVELRQTGTRIHTVEVDVSDPESIAKAFEYCDANLARLDNLVTCAAVITAKRIFEQDWAHWHRALDVNLLGTFFTVQAAVRRMLENPDGGNIV